MNIKALQQAALAFIFTVGFAASASAADLILFDADGAKATNGAVWVGGFDWSPSSTLADGAIPAGEGDSFNTYSHGALNGFTDADGDPAGAPIGLNTAGSGFEITFISAFSETISSLTTSAATCVGTCDGAGGDDEFTFTQTIQLVQAGTQTVNFFQIYYDDLSDGTGLKSSSLSGLGFDDGQLILSADVTAVSGNFTTKFTFTDVNNNGSFDLGTDTLTGFGLLDQSSNGDDWGGQLTVSGEGSTQLVGDVTYQDYAFFQTNISNLLADLFFNTSNVLPFKETNPSKSFDTDTSNPGGTLSLAGGGISLGSVNGLNGPDILFQTDANNSFLASPIPEPSSVLLLSLGLLFMGGMAVRRTRRGISS